MAGSEWPPEANAAALLSHPKFGERYVREWETLIHSSVSPMKILQAFCTCKSCPFLLISPNQQKGQMV